MRKIIAFAPFWALFSLFAFDVWAAGGYVNCQPGKYWNGYNCSNNCGLGHYCPGGQFPTDSGTQGMYPCPADRPMSPSGSSSIIQCELVVTCAPGRYLKKAQRVCNLPCKEGYYCPGGTFGLDQYHDQGLVECPPATPLSKNSTQNTSVSACTATVTFNAGQYLPAGASTYTSCERGYYCTGGTFGFDASNDQGRTQCPSSAPYTSSIAAKTESACQTLTITCAAGKYLTAGGYSTSSCKNCPKGYYCEGGTFNFDPTQDQGMELCPPATPYSPGSSTSDAACTVAASVTVSAGRYLPKGYSSPSSCPEGYYCEGGTFSVSTTDDQGSTACPVATPYSPAQSSSASACVVIQCTAGNYVPAGEITCAACPIGSYCAGGTFGRNDSADQGITACDSATPYSMPGSSSSSACYAAICSPGRYLPAASSTCQQCPIGSYCSGGTFDLNNNDDQGITACPTGYTSATYAAYVSECQITCSAGEYLTAGASACTQCPANSYCPGGTFGYNATEVQGITGCSGTTPLSQAGSDDAGDCYTATCSLGQYLPAAGLACITCPESSYCVGGTELDYNANTPQGITACSGTTLLSPAGSDDAGDCYTAICSAGQYLPADALSCTQCREGYYCLGGTEFDYDENNDQGLTQCDPLTPYSQAGAQNSGQCFSISSCSAGEFLAAGASECSTCPAHHYCTGLQNPVYNSSQNQGATDCPQATPYSMPGASSSSECVATLNITCAAGEYLPAKGITCKRCTKDNYCPGGIYTYDSIVADQGIERCSSIAGGDSYAYSDEGSSLPQQCRSVKAFISCSALNPVENGLAEYCDGPKCQTPSAYSATYYGGNTEIDNISACRLFDLTCNAGYNKEPSSDGPLMKYVKQAHNISKADTSYRALNGNSGSNSGAVNGFGDSTGITNGTAVIAWNDGTEVYLSASCTATAGTKGGDIDVITEKTKSGDSGGAKAGDENINCWCQMTGYDIGNGTVSVNDADSVFVGGEEGCQSKCSEECVTRFIASLPFRTNVLGTYGKQMACVEQTYSCDPGYYLPGRYSTTCTLCEAGYVCAGLTNVHVSEATQGRVSCSAATSSKNYTASDAGTSDAAFCYAGNTKPVDCSDLVTVSGATLTFANSPVTKKDYYGGGSVITPFGGCAVTGGTCKTDGQSLIGTDGPLANYESPLYGMPNSDSNTNIYYRAIDGSSSGSSGTNDKHGDSTGMTNGTFRLVYWDELEITGTSSCVAGAKEYNCNCGLTGYKIGNNSAVSVTPTEQIYTARKITFKDQSTCEAKCSAECAIGLAAEPKFGSFGMNKSCAVAYTCAPGEYLPANSTVCATCTQNHWCPGGTWEQAATAQGLEDCPSEFPYSAAGSRSSAFCYKEPATLQCSAVNPVRGANVTYANSTAATKRYNDGGIQTDTIGACAISSLTCNAGYTTTNNWSDGPLVNYINASRNLNLSATKFLSNDGLTKSGTGEFFGGSATGLNSGTFELVYSNGTTINGRSSCNSTSGDLFETKTNGTFNTSSEGTECWCNMTGYQFSGSSAVSVNDTSWVYFGSIKPKNSCAASCTKECIKILLKQPNANGEYETALFGSYGKNSTPPCNPNSYSITWYDGNKIADTNQCYYDDKLTIPDEPTASTGYKIKWQIRSGI